ncbi:MAG: hypothetical protein QM611_04430 [Microbacterium sp.]|uniref:hypothetical protein n=1 Tax=Microbacterium sp. TaxID=51671 RepID=UPI0039E2D3CB
MTNDRRWMAGALASTALVAMLAGCSGGGAPASTADGGAPTESGGTGSESGGSAYSLPAVATSGPYTMTVTEVIDPADASAAWGAYSDDVRMVALEVEVEAEDGSRSLVNNPSCFTLIDGNGEKPQIQIGFATADGTPLGEADGIEGQLVYKMDDPQVALASLVYDCTGNEEPIELALKPAG